MWVLRLPPLEGQDRDGAARILRPRCECVCTDECFGWCGVV